MDGLLLGHVSSDLANHVSLADPPPGAEGRAPHDAGRRNRRRRWRQRSQHRFSPCIPGS
ncbi:MAG: hypothetical protein DME01_28125 [Candidatus Rokuibacteriota bacterium]|nr:MAG: hypothetical protein DME01_28125 [Candidatus Rokubacteria bacterium]